MSLLTKLWMKCSLAFLFFSVQAQVLAIEIRVPSGTKTRSIEDLDRAGNEILLWIGAFLGFIVLACIAYAVYLIWTGESETGWKWVRNIIYGALIFAFLGGIIFAIIV